MITAPPGGTFESFLQGAPTGLTGTLTWRLIDPSDGSIEIAASTAGITEPATGTYRKAATAPTVADTYLIVWKNGATEITEELVVTSNAATITTPSGADLTDLATVREFMQKGTGNQQTEQDPLITNLIPRASRAIQRYTRVIAPAQTGVSKVLLWRGRGYISLNPWYLRTATSVQLDTDTSSPIALTASDYTLQPLPAEDGVYTHLRLLGSQMVESNLELLDQTYSTTLQRQVTVTGDWGYAAVPEDVKHWATVTVVEWIRKDVSAYSTAFDANEDRLDRPEELPRAVKAGLRQYRREDAPRLPALAAPKSRGAEAI